MHIAVDTLGHLLALYVTPANEQDRAQVQELAQQVQQITGEAVQVAFVDQGYSADKCGYDIESRIPRTGQLRFIEVKGRILCASAVTVTKNEIITALNKPDRFILALVEVPQSTTWSEKNCGIRYVCRPFTLEPDFAMTSTNYDWQILWN